MTIEYSDNQFIAISHFILDVYFNMRQHDHLIFR